jgi:hypothetical protein
MATYLKGIKDEKNDGWRCSVFAIFDFLFIPQ